jgi:curved DNA-binding protein CbpA
MKKIGEYRRLLGVTKTANLKELKTIYRDFMKEFHPDKFAANDELKQEAEEKSKEIIEAYHFLVSVAPETAALRLPEYTATITNSIIIDFSYQSLILTLYFKDGSSYEYFDVPRNIYSKLINADSQNRFARRHICSSFPYRNVVKSVGV